MSEAPISLKDVPALPRHLLGASFRHHLPEHLAKELEQAIADRRTIIRRLNAHLSELEAALGRPVTQVTEQTYDEAVASLMAEVQRTVPPITPRVVGG